MTTYEKRRGKLQLYFDQTALEAWKRLTSDAAVSNIRASVRAGRDQMRQTLMGWLPDQMEGLSLLDAGCGTGALAIAVASRGGRVIAVDLSPNLVELAIERLPKGTPARNLVDFQTGDMLDHCKAEVDFSVAMDSLIHYDESDVISALERLAERTRRALLFTFAPATVALRAMHLTGKLFPRADRSPAIVPISEARLRTMIANSTRLKRWEVTTTCRIRSGFYISQAMMLSRIGEGRTW